MFDCVIVGAGFGGLGSALSLAERGAKVLLCEALTYPGGCASTYSRRGYRFEAGATLSSGLAEGQLFGQWIRRHALDVPVEWLDPVLEVRAPGFQLTVPGSREAFVNQLCALPDAPSVALRRFFDDQRAIADTLWGLFDDPELLPPLSLASLGRHALRSPRYLPLLGAVGRPLSQWLDRYGLAEWRPLRHWLDGLCQITVQCPAAEAEAPFALAAMDYLWRGTGHVRGGIGALAAALTGAVCTLGGEVRFAERVRGLKYEDGAWTVNTRSGPVRARAVVANLLPGDLPALLNEPAPDLEARHAPVAEGWGAVMLYRAVRGLSGPAHHLDLHDGGPLIDGHHTFVSIAGPLDERGGEPEHRVLTASTHVSLPRVQGAEAARVVADIQAQMRATLDRYAPELGDVVMEMTASPRTFARFTRRRGGAVGGVPRRAGLDAYAQLGPVEARPRLWLAGDSVFPGQSTLATALGGVRVAEAVVRAG